MIVLGIETSCDETAIALVERGERNRVLSERIKSQVALHHPYGGIVPEIASRNHCEFIDLLCRQALEESGLALEQIDLIALTLGPGLIGSLLVGLSFAKGLSFSRRLPLATVDHILAHVESAFIGHPEIPYPLLALVVSGGHTTLFFQKSRFQTEVVAKTRDDAAGEVMDKIAKHFGLGYPGGPILDRIYDRGDPHRFPFSMPRLTDGSNDFSFSGYKTAVLRHAEKGGIQEGSPAFYDLASSFLHSVVDYLVDKTKETAKRLEAKSVIVAGGVSRNTLLRRRFSETFAHLGIPLYLSEARFCTDNAAMVAWLGYEKYMAYPQANYFDLTFNSYSRALFRESRKHR